ncbi:hypothetical protein A616_17070 [Brevibacillus brevis X23]|nr:hypothetical protein A616_17070 [Brevibacillus brevis X23]
MSQFLYHASPFKNLPYLEPQTGSQYVYATHDPIVAATFAHRSGRGHIFDMGRDKFGVFTISEKVTGAFNWRYRQSEGYVYKVDNALFSQSTSWSEEQVAVSRVDIVDVREISNVKSHLLSLKRNGQLNIVYSQWMPTEYELFNLIKPWLNDPRENREDAIAFGETFYPNFRRHFS